MAPMANGWYVVYMVTHSPELSDVQLDSGVWGVTVGIRDLGSKYPGVTCVSQDGALGCHSSRWQACEVARLRKIPVGRSNSA